MADIDDGRSISVVLPNFNHGQFIAQAVDALVRQDLPPLEIIIIDDGSTDDSVSIIQDVAKQFPSVRFLQNPTNIGLVRTQNLGLTLASGRFVYLAAADDHVAPGFFAYAIKLLEKNPEAGLFCGDTFVRDGATSRFLGYRPPVMPRFRPGYVKPEHVRQLLAKGDNWIVTGAALIRKSALLDAGGLDQELDSFADGFAVRKIALKCGICYAPRVVLIWRVFETSLSRQAALDVNKARNLIEASCRKIRADSAFPKDYAERFRDHLRFNIARLALQSNPPDLTVVNEIGLSTSFDKWAVKVVQHGASRRAVRPFILGILWLRLHPYKALDLVTSFLVRRALLSFTAENRSR